MRAFSVKRAFLFLLAGATLLFGAVENDVALNRQKISALNSNLAELQESFEGVRSLMTSLNSQVKTLNARMSELENSLKFTNKRLDSDLTKVVETSKILTKSVNVTDSNVAIMSKNIAELRRGTNSAINLQNRNINILGAQINSLNALVASLNSTVQQANVERVLNADPEFAAIDSAKILSSAEVLRVANEAFEAKNFIKARELYQKVVSESPFFVNFRLGEVAFFNKEYLTAISYYQKSLRENAKSEFMPTLLYHTAVSFEKVGQTADAYRFYTTLKTRFPESVEAQNSPNLSVK